MGFLIGYLCGLGDKESKMNEYLKVNYKYYCFREARFWLVMGSLLLSGSLSAYLMHFVLGEGLLVLSTIFALVGLAPFLFAGYYVIQVKLHERKAP